MLIAADDAMTILDYIAISVLIVSGSWPRTGGLSNTNDDCDSLPGVLSGVKQNFQAS
jgi:hypothetical protein